MMKTSQDKHMTDCIGAVYAEKEIEQLLPIGPSLVCNENQTNNDVIDGIGVVVQDSWFLV